MTKNSILMGVEVEKAEALLKQNRLRDAVKAYERACQLDGNNAELWSSLSALRFQLGELNKAGYCLRKAIDLAPASPVYYCALGSVLHRQKQRHEAIRYYRKAIQLQPDFVVAHYYLAVVFQESGRLAEAIDAYRQLLVHKPDHVEGLNNLGLLLKSQGKIEDAFNILGKAHELQPGSVEVLTSLANTYILKGMERAAIDLLRRATHIRPDYFNAHRLLGDAFFNLGMAEEALKSYETSLSLRPKAIQAIVGKANLLEKTGEYDKAYCLIQPLIDGKKIEEIGIDAAILYFNLSRRFGAQEKAIDLLNGMLSVKNIPDAAAMRIYFSLGKYHDKKGCYQEAFQCFYKANTLQGRKYDINAMRNQVDEIIATYNTKYRQEMPLSNNDSSCPVFIVGMPRSGTTLAEQILASHPEVFGAGELREIDEAAGWLAKFYGHGRPYPAFVSRVPQATINGVSNKHISSLAAISDDASRVTDKMPQNFIYLGLIAQLFPSASLVHCVRNPLDTCLSCYFGHFGGIGHDYTYDLKTLGAYYVQYKRLMHHWSEMFGDRLFEVRYENLVQDQESVSRSMVEFCGLEWNEECLNFHQSKRSINTLSYEQVRQPINSHSVGKWMNYAKYLRPLIEELNAGGVNIHTD